MSAFSLASLNHRVQLMLKHVNVEELSLPELHEVLRLHHKLHKRNRPLFIAIIQCVSQSSGMLALYLV